MLDVRLVGGHGDGEYMKFWGDQPPQAVSRYYTVHQDGATFDELETYNLEMEVGDDGPVWSYRLQLQGS